MSAARFSVTARGDGVVSIRIATDENPWLDDAWLDGWSSALGDIDGDASVRAIVLEGCERYFSAGASRSILAGPRAPNAIPDHAARVAHAPLEVPLPVIAAAAGHAVGGGLVLALLCDVVVLSEESLYGANFMALGFTPGMGATHVVPEAFGAPLGRELLCTGRMLTGAEIREARCPLSHAVMPRAGVGERALSLAREIAAAPREAVLLLKRNLSGARREALDRALAVEQDAHRRLFADPVVRAAIASRYPVSLIPDGSDPP